MKGIPIWWVSRFLCSVVVLDC